MRVQTNVMFFRISSGKRIRTIFLAVLLWVPAAILIGCHVKVTEVPYPPFFEATRNGDIAEADRLLRSGQFVTQRTVGNQTPLHLAAAAGKDEMVIWLLARDASPIAKDDNGKTPADFAHEHNRSSTETIIVDLIRLAERENSAIAVGDARSLQQLLKNDVRKYSVLHVFSLLGALDKVRSEITLGADLNARTTLEMTPLHKAVLGNHLDVARFLIAKGADVNAYDIYNNTALYYAVFSKNPQMAALLLEAGADKSVRSVVKNETPLQLAERSGDSEVASLLRER